MRLILIAIFIFTSLLYSSDNNSISEIELIYYNMAIVDSTVKIEWETASEYNNKHFIIERATESPELKFKVIDTIAGSGNSIMNQKYFLIDSTIEYGNWYYYKLTAEAFDGNINTYQPGIIEVSEIETSVLNINNDQLLEFELLENRIIIKSSTPLQSQLTLFNLEGKTIIPKIEKLNDSNYAVDISNLPNGKYILLNNQNLICKFIK